MLIKKEKLEISPFPKKMFSTMRLSMEVTNNGQEFLAADFITPHKHARKDRSICQSDSTPVYESFLRR